MKIAGIILVTIAGCVVLLFASVAWSGSADLTPQITNDSKYAVDNEPVHMVGCKVLPEAASPKVILPPVVKTFVSLPCATEVPPPLEAIEHKKRGEKK